MSPPVTPGVDGGTGELALREDEMRIFGGDQVF